MEVKDRILQGLKAVQDSVEILSKEEISKMQAVLYAFANKFLDNIELEEVREVVMMTRLGQIIWEDGVEQGVERGIEALILDNLEENKTAEQICGKLMKRFSLSSEEADQYYRKYSKI